MNYIFQAVINFFAILIGLILTLNDKFKKKLYLPKVSKEESYDKGNEKDDINQNYETNNSEIPLNNYYPDSK